MSRYKEQICLIIFDVMVFSRLLFVAKSKSLQGVTPRKGTDIFRKILTGTKNLEIPEHVVIINGGASMMIPALEHLIEAPQRQVPQKIDLIRPTSFIHPKKDNLFSIQPFGQGVGHLPAASVLMQHFGYNAFSRPSLKDHHLSVDIYIDELLEKFKKKHPDCSINHYRLLEDEKLYQHPQGQIVIGSPFRGISASLYDPAVDRYEPVIINASRPYGKILNQDMQFFEQENLNYKLRLATQSIVDLYQMSDEEIRIYLKNQSVSGYVPLIGTGLTTLWVLKNILDYGFKPLILSSQPNFSDYLSLMKDANAWLKEDLKAKLCCDEKELNDILLSMTYQIDQLDVLSMRLKLRRNESLVLKKIFDCTGYCVHKTYADEVSQNLVLDPFLPQRISFEKIAFIREKSDAATSHIQDEKIKELIDYALSEDIDKIMLKASTRGQSLFERATTIQSLLPEYTLAQQAFDEIAMVEMVEDIDKNFILKALETRKILILLEYIGTLDEALYNPVSRKKRSKEPLNHLHVKHLQIAYKALQQDSRSEVGKEILKTLDISLNYFSPDGKHYFHHGHSPLGSAAFLTKISHYFLGKDVGFKITDSLTVEEEIVDIAKELWNILDDKTISLENIESAVQRAVREMRQNSHEIFIYEKDRIHFRMQAHEFADYFIEKILNYCLPCEAQRFSVKKAECRHYIIKSDIGHFGEYYENSARSRPASS